MVEAIQVIQFINEQSALINFGGEWLHVTIKYKFLVITSFLVPIPRLILAQLKTKKSLNK